MRPCDECGGSGWTGSQYMENGEVVEYDADRRDCLRCVDVPWLPCPKGVPILGGGYMKNACVKCGGRGRFKPDPDTIEWRCEHLQLYWPADDDTPGNRRGLPYNCKQEPSMHAGCGWVARPQRLEVADETIP